MSPQDTRAKLAAEAARRVEAVREDPHGRLALADDAYINASDGRLEHFARAELAFIGWEIRRGVLDPVARVAGRRGGSDWWRTVNEQLLQDCEEGSLLYCEGYGDGGSTKAVDLWLRFFSAPSPQTWYCAHNASIVSGYLEASPLAVSESRAEQVLMNIILTRALYAYLLAAGQARLGWIGLLARIGKWLANPAGEGIVAVIDIPDFYPGSYPMNDDEEGELLGMGMSPQALIGRLGNFVVFQDIQRVFTWNAERTGISDLMTLLRDGSPCYPAGMPQLMTAAGRDASVVRELDDVFERVARAVIPDAIEPFLFGPQRETTTAVALREVPSKAPAELVPWVAGVSLQDVCFVSWEVPAADVRAVLPDTLEIDEFDGKTYITAVALRAVNMHFRNMPSIPGASEFLELNFRAYVRHNGSPGIWFFSVDAQPGSAFEWLADNVFRIPYHEADMNMAREGGWTTYTSSRCATPARFALTYNAEVDDPGRDLEPGTLQEFICRRDSAFSRLFGRIMRFEVRHPEWKMQPASIATVDATPLFGAVGVPAPASDPFVYFSRRSDGVMYPPVPW